MYILVVAWWLRLPLRWQFSICSVNWYLSVVKFSTVKLPPSVGFRFSCKILKKRVLNNTCSQFSMLFVHVAQFGLNSWRNLYRSFLKHPCHIKYLIQVEIQVPMSSIFSQMVVRYQSVCPPSFGCGLALLLPHWHAFASLLSFGFYMVNA